jgi:hypothetical protein
MVSLKKDKFLILLRNIVDTLERNNVIYEIPLCYSDKNDFTYQDIIISNSANLNNITSELYAKIINNSKTKCIVDIDGFRINFILSPDDEIKYNFNFYSWNFLPYLLSALCKGIYLSYDNTGLRYNNILITKNLKKIFDLLGIPFKDVYGLIIPFEKDLFSMITKSDFFRPSFFTEEKMKEIDPNYEYNKYNYDKFKKSINGIADHKSESEEDIMFLIHAAFPECKIYDKSLENFIKSKNMQ